MASDVAAEARWSDAEWQVRTDLAACYRLVAHYGMDDSVYTHISARLPEAPDQFLLNPFGLAFDEITATSLMKLDLDGNVVESSGYEINQAGYVIHSACLRARDDVACVIHTHTTAGMAVSAQRDGLLPLTQHSLPFYQRIGYHDYEGIALDTEERARLGGNLGPYRAMILRNHGLLAVGQNVAEAFEILVLLERACQAQVAAQAGGAALNLIPDDIAEATARQFETISGRTGDRSWPAYLRRIERLDPSFRD